MIWCRHLKCKGEGVVYLIMYAAEVQYKDTLSYLWHDSIMNWCTVNLVCKPTTAFMFWKHSLLPSPGEKSQKLLGKRRALKVKRQMMINSSHRQPSCCISVVWLYPFFSLRYVFSFTELSWLLFPLFKICVSMKVFFEVSSTLRLLQNILGLFMNIHCIRIR